VVGDDGKLRAPDLRQGTLSVPLEIIPVLYSSVTALRYELHRREQPLSCDCAAIQASGLERKPQCPELIPTGPASDGYHAGDGFRCSSCGTRWLVAATEDSRGRPFWTALK
jgi:hypothetical protein